MAEYIEREALIEDISELEVSGVFTEALKNEVLKIISEQATADVTEVKHGKWEDSARPYSYYQYKCNVCGCDEYRQTDRNGKCEIMNYCPNCGAKME